jgi:hypothetical protein
VNLHPSHIQRNIKAVQATKQFIVPLGKKELCIKAKTPGGGPWGKKRDVLNAVRGGRALTAWSERVNGYV